jgi:hypothetical protein
MRISETTFDISKIGFKDAFHVPGIAVTSDFEIKPGTYVKFSDSSMKKVIELTGAGQFHGIVDPFVDHLISPGEIFYVIVHPSMSNNLRHEFTIDISLAKNERVWEEQDEEDQYDSCKGCYN